MRRVRPGMALLLNFTIDRQSLWLNNVFWIPSYLAASVFLGMALEWLALRAPRPGVQRGVLALALVLCTGVPLVSHYARNTKRHYHYMRGRDALERGELDAAKEALDLAAVAGGDAKELLNNIASAYAEANVLDAAEDFYKRTLAVDPAYTTARKNLAKTYLQRGRAEEAVLELEDALREDAKDPEALRLSAKALVEIGWKDEAIQRYEYLAGLQPGDAEVSWELGLLYLNHRKDAHAAQQCLSRSLRANPDQPGLADLLASLATEATTPGIPEAPKLELPVLPDGSAPMPPAIPMPDFGLPEIHGLPAVP